MTRVSLKSGFLLQLLQEVKLFGKRKNARSWGLKAWPSLQVSSTSSTIFFLRTEKEGLAGDHQCPKAWTQPITLTLLIPLEKGRKRVYAWPSTWNNLCINTAGVIIPQTGHNPYDEAQLPSVHWELCSYNTGDYSRKVCKLQGDEAGFSSSNTPW